MKELSELLDDIASRPQTHVTQINKLEFKIELGGELMESYMRLGDIQSEIEEKVGDKYELHTVYGEGQDAILRFTKKDFD